MESNNNKIELLYDGYFYDVTEFIDRHPGGDIIKLYTEFQEDATVAVNQFHYRSLKKVLARMRGLKRRPAEEVNADDEITERHKKLTYSFQQLLADVEQEGLMEPDPSAFIKRTFTSFCIFVAGFLLTYFTGESLGCRFTGLFLMTLAGGQNLWLGHEAGHNSFTGVPWIDKVFQSFSFGFVYGLSASCWNSTHSEHHAMPQHETKDADLKTMPLLAFTTKVVKIPVSGRRESFWLRHQHILFTLCDTFLVTMTWKFNHHLKFCWRNKQWIDLVFMAGHYIVFIPVLGVFDWLFVTWLGSIYVLGNLILSHTHLPVVDNGRKLHWVEYAFHHTTNIRSSWWVDWWTGHLNYQIEHHLFPTMPEYKGKLCRDRVKKFAKENDLPYQLCSYWEAVEMAYLNLEHVANEIRCM